MTVRDITKPTAINEQDITYLENRLAVLDRIEERLKNIEKLLSHWTIPECPTDTGIDFQPYLGNQLANPYQVGHATITVYMPDEKTGIMAPVKFLSIEARSINFNTFVGLRCGYQTDIEFKDKKGFKRINLYYFEGGGKIQTIFENGKIDEIKVPNTYQPTLVSVGNNADPIQKISLFGVNEMFLLAFCAKREAEE
jgi:hypothetical protein